MANKTSFSAEEWQQLLASPMVSAMAVTAADPSSLFGLVKEGLAASGALASAKSDAAANPLIKAVVAEFETSEGRTAARDHLKSQFAGSQAASIKPNAIDALRKVSALLDTKAPEDAAAFKAWLRATAQRVAEAAKEGGFLGFGGVQVSEAEKATLTEISAALSTDGFVAPAGSSAQGWPSPRFSHLSRQRSGDSRKVAPQAADHSKRCRRTTDLLDGDRPIERDNRSWLQRFQCCAESIDVPLCQQFR